MLFIYFSRDVLGSNVSWNSFFELNGKFFVGGLALPKVEADVAPKLTIRDAEGGLPSPFFGEQRKDNPKAKNEVQIDNIVVGDEPIRYTLTRQCKDCPNTDWEWRSKSVNQRLEKVLNNWSTAPKERVHAIFVISGNI